MDPGKNVSKDYESDFGGNLKRLERISWGAHAMDKTYKVSDIQKGFHLDGYRIDKTALPINFYTKWEITPEGKWINPKPTCFDSMPREGWRKNE